MFRNLQIRSKLVAIVLIPLLALMAFATAHAVSSVRPRVEAERLNRATEFAETLTALVGAIPADGPVVLDLDLEVPMEVTLALDGDTLVVHAAPGHSRFISGFLPPVHTTRLHVVALPPEGWRS